MSNWFRPSTVSDALATLAADAANPPADSLDRLTVLAGATDFYPAATARHAWFQKTPRNVLDISGIQELQSVSEGEGMVTFGAMATWSDVASKSRMIVLDSLQQAARQVGGVQIQNRGTLAGNICNASPAADGMPPLLALDAEVIIQSSGEKRLLPLSAFVLGNRKTALRPGEMVTAIRFPRPQQHEQSVFLKLGARAYLVISIASVAANITVDNHGKITSARIAVGACSAVPQRLTALEQRLLGEATTRASRAVEPAMLSSLSPLDDVRASAEYRMAAALTLVRRALDELSLTQEKAA